MRINAYIYNVSENKNQMYSPKEIAALAGVHQNSVYRWINNGLKIYRRGDSGRILIKWEDYETWCGM